MIKGFTVSNFKSFNYDATGLKHSLTMLKGTSRSKADHVLDNNILKIAVLFGSNAAGKSNFIDGMRIVKKIITGNDAIESISDAYCRNYDVNRNRPVTFTFQIEVDMDRFTPSSNTSSDGTYEYHPDQSCTRIPFEYEIELSFRYSDTPRITKETVYDANGEIVISRTSPDNLNDVNVDMDLLYKERTKLVEYRRKLAKETETLSPEHTGTYVDEADLVLNLMRTEKDPLKEEKEWVEKEISEYDSKIATAQKSLSNARNRFSFITPDPSIENLRENCELSGNMTSSQLVSIIKSIYHWFDYTLEIIDPYGFVIPELDTDSFEQLSAIIREFDVNIQSVRWSSVNDEKEKREIIDNLRYRDLERIEECRRISVSSKMECSVIVGDITAIYRFAFWHGEPSIKKLITIHDDGTSHDLMEESDGTCRLIELSSILLEPRTDKVYVVDELDRRLHPVLTRRFMELYLEDTSEGSKKRQLIVTTHETRLLTTELFRIDEIWFIEHDDAGCSNITGALEKGVTFNKHLDRIYLEDKALGGVPRI